MKHLLFFGIAFAAFHFSYSNIPDFCALPEDGGQGTNFNFAVYYNASGDRCNPFIYKGQGGNGNRFENERECMRNCSPNVDNIYPMNVTKGCTLKKSKGQCNGEYLRFYYDSVHGKCKKFHWSGCIGNGNRFVTYEICNSTCAGVRGDPNEDDGKEDDEPDTPVAIICGVLLGVIIVIFLITVTVLTINSKKKKSKKAAGKSGDAKAESPLQEPGIEMA